MTHSSKPPSKPPPSEEEIVQMKRDLEDACASVNEKTKKHEAAADSLKKTISNPKLQAVRLPTPSQLELEQSPEKR